jgi:hypothetical protein
MRLNCLFLFVSLFIASFCLNAQSNEGDLSVKFNQYRSQTLQEKIFVHPDRTAYISGELIWFKVYCVDASLHKNSDVSKVAYIEVIDKSNEAVLQTKVELKNGTGSGSLFIPALFSSGNFVLRAYTNWMKNSGAEFYFHQSITIINPFIKLEQDQAETKKPAYDLQFFPEGGYALEGVKTKFGFRGTDTSGKGFSFIGKVIDSKGNTVAEFQPTKYGIGSFYFTPSLGETYTTTITDERNNLSYHSFPAIEKIGFALSLTDHPAHISVDVTALGVGAQPVYLFAHTRLATFASEKKFMVDGKAQFVVNKDLLGEGVTHLTVFDQNLKPVCERLFFKQPERKINLAVSASKKNYHSRELVELTLSSNVSADVSISVYQRDSIPNHKRQNIYEYLWLTSDLKGTIENPEYYFGSSSAELREAIDNLMLTHGWRRFRWNDVLDFKPVVKFLPEFRGHLIHGKVLDKNGNVVADVLTSLSSPDKLIQLYGSRSNTQGEVRYEVKNFLDEKKIFVQAADSSYQVKIENPFSSEYTKNQTLPFTLSETISKEIINRSVAMQVQDIYKKEQINQFRNLKRDSIQFYGKPDRVYYLDDYVRFPLLEEVVREYVSAVFVHKSNGRFRFNVKDQVNNSTMRENPLVLLDGVPVLDNNKLLAFNPLKIKKVEVVGREYHLGPYVFPGILSFFTYSGDLAGFEVSNKAVALNYEGLQRHREFYSPVYDASYSQKHIPDSRTLLYWCNSKKIENGKTVVQFFTSDTMGEFEVVVEGLGKQGEAGSVIHSFFVNKDGQ